MSGLGNLYRAKRNPPKDGRPSFSGRIVIVTGSSSGVGYEAAVKFVALGAEKVVLAVRSIAKGERAKACIEKRTGRRGIAEVWHLDMLDYDSIKAFAARVDKELKTVDVAILNAGVMQALDERSRYGWEKTMQVNVISTALLGLLLLPKMKASKSLDHVPVLELVGSSLHTRITRLNSPEGSGPLGWYSDHFSRAQYGISKLFMEHVNIGLAEAAKSGTSQRPEVHVLSVSPGLCSSDLGRAFYRWYLAPGVWAFQALFQRSCEEGARMYISGTQVGEEGHGRFWHEGQVRE